MDNIKQQKEESVNKIYKSMWEKINLLPDFCENRECLCESCHLKIDLIILAAQVKRLLKQE